MPKVSTRVTATAKPQSHHSRASTIRIGTGGIGRGELGPSALRSSLFGMLIPSILVARYATVSYQGWGTIAEVDLVRTARSERQRRHYVGRHYVGRHSGGATLGRGFQAGFEPSLFPPMGASRNSLGLTAFGLGEVREKDGCLWPKADDAAACLDLDSGARYPATPASTANPLRQRHRLDNRDHCEQRERMRTAQLPASQDVNQNPRQNTLRRVWITIRSRLRPKPTTWPPRLGIARPRWQLTSTSVL